MSSPPRRASVGLRSLELRDVDRDLHIPTLVFFPTASGERRERLGPFEIDVALDAEPSGEGHDLVVVSHGTGGTHLSHRELARDLASRGFVACVPLHTKNNRFDDTLASSPDLLASRTRDVRAVVDGIAASELGPAVDTSRYAVVGHSMGAATALALAGGVPTSLPHQREDRRAVRVDAVADPRVDAIALLAPATPWFRLRGALDAVRVPILMIASYHDEAAPYFYMCQVVLDGVPDVSKVDARYVERAHHYAFLSPWPEAMRGPQTPPSMDPPGFDRAAFHTELYGWIAAFLERSRPGSARA